MKETTPLRIPLFLFAVFVFLMPAWSAHAQGAQLVQDQTTFQRARVITAKDLGTAQVAGTNVSSRRQELTARIISGADAGKTVTFTNEFTQLAPGQEFYARHITNPEEQLDQWSVADPYRLPVLIGIALAFVALLILFGGIQGIRGFASLIGSLVIIFYLLIPSIYSGHSPVLLAIGITSLIIIVGSYVTHGINRTTTSAMLGMLATVAVTGAATYGVIHAAHLSGFSTEANVYLNFDTGGRISMIGLLFGGIMIGLLGVLYDMAIGQAVAVEELYRAGSYTRAQVFRRAMRIGREHIGALVNTLAIAYVGAELPLLLLFKQTDAGLAYTLNGELFATEIIRILMGSIGIILAMPMTTLIATYILHRIHGMPVRDGEELGHSHHH